MDLKDSSPAESTCCSYRGFGFDHSTHNVDPGPGATSFSSDL